LAVVLGRLTAAFAFVTFLVVFFMIASLLWTGALPYACRERKLVLILVGTSVPYRFPYR
jgi:hypothetical protein